MPQVSHPHTKSRCERNYRGPRATAIITFPDKFPSPPQFRSASAESVPERSKHSNTSRSLRLSCPASRPPEPASPLPGQPESAPQNQTSCPLRAQQFRRSRQSAPFVRRFRSRSNYLTSDHVRRALTPLHNNTLAEAHFFESASPIAGLTSSKTDSMQACYSANP